MPLAQRVFVNKQFILWNALAEGIVECFSRDRPTPAPAAVNTAAPNKPKAVTGPTPGTIATSMASENQ